MPEGECRFAVSNTCLTHRGEWRAVLCDHAAQALQRRVEEVERLNAAHIIRIEHLSSEVARYMAGQEIGDERLASLEAANTRLRESLRRFPLGHDHWDNTQQSGVGCELCIRQREHRDAALSPDAGRAILYETQPPEEVEPGVLVAEYESTAAHRAELTRLRAVAKSAHQARNHGLNTWALTAHPESDSYKAMKALDDALAAWREGRGKGEK